MSTKARGIDDVVRKSIGKENVIEDTVSAALFKRKFIGINYIRGRKKFIILYENRSGSQDVFLIELRGRKKSEDTIKFLEKLFN